MCFEISDSEFHIFVLNLKCQLVFFKVIDSYIATAFILLELIKANLFGNKGFIQLGYVRFKVAYFKSFFLQKTFCTGEDCFSSVNLILQILYSFLVLDSSLFNELSVLHLQILDFLLCFSSNVINLVLVSLMQLLNNFLVLNLQQLQVSIDFNHGVAVVSYFLLQNEFLLQESLQHLLFD